MTLSAKSSVIIDSLTLTQSGISGGKCYCLGQTADYIKVPLEKQNLTDLVTSSLGMQNADAILPLTESYLSEKTLAFSSQCLKAFIAFLLNATNPRHHKERVIYILRDQLELHPSCATYMWETYETLLLSSDDSQFKNLTILDYVLRLLEEDLLSQKGVNFFVQRTTGRRRREATYTEIEKAEPSSAKNPRCEIPTETETHFNKSQKESDAKDIIFFVLDILTEILTHNLRATLNRGEPLIKSMLAKLIFRGESSTLLYKPLVKKTFTVYKLCTKNEERRYVRNILELMATTCLLIDEEQNETNLLQLGTCTHHFVTEFETDVFENEEIFELSVIDAVTCLNLVWLRYRIASFILKKLWDKPVLKGLEGIVKELNAILKLAKNKIKDKPEALRIVDSNQISATPGINDWITACRNDDLETVKRLREAGMILNVVDGRGRCALHIAAKHGSVKCVQFLLRNVQETVDSELKDDKGFTPLMYAERGNHATICEMLISSKDTSQKMKTGRTCKRLPPLACKMIMIIVDSTLKMMDHKYFSYRENTIQQLKLLIPLVKELYQMKDIPKELFLLSYILNETK